MDVFVRRCIALVLLGIVQFAVFLWPGEILFNHGLPGFFLPAFRKARPKPPIGWTLAAIIAVNLTSVPQVVARAEKVERGHQAERLAAQRSPLTGIRSSRSPSS